MYINIEQHDDPIAAKTQWKPLRDTNYLMFGSHYLVQKNDEKVYFKPTISSYIIDIIIVITSFTSGLMILFYSNESILLRIPVSIIFFALTYYFVKKFYKYTSNIIFDRADGTLQVKSVFTNINIKPQVPLIDVYAIQLLYIYDDDSSDSTTEYYEFNLVLKDGERIGIVGLGSKKRILKYAKDISKFLNVPIWDMTNIAQK
jgi:hypothetical protein